MLATIKNKKLIADNTLYMEFSLAEKIDFKAGQWFTVELKNPPFSDERGATRHFTIVNSPEEKNLIAMATRLSESAFKKSLNELVVGSEVEINAPFGDFMLPAENSSIVMLAAGIGITPFISQLRHIKNNKLNYKIKLLYFNRTQQSTAFFNEINSLKLDLTNFKPIFIMSDDANWNGETGNINSELIDKYSSNLKQPLFMVVGPPKMVETALAELKKINIPENQIKIENFTGY